MAGRDTRPSPERSKSLQGLFCEALGPCTHGGQEEVAGADALPGAGMGLFPSPHHRVTPRSVSKRAEHDRTSAPRLGKAKAAHAKMWF